MFRKLLTIASQPIRPRVSSLLHQTRFLANQKPAESASVIYKPPHDVHETDEEFDNRYYQYFSRPDIDGWEIRKALNELMGMDLIPEPRIIEAAFRACRRVNDHSLCVRYLEAVKWKADNHDKDIYPYLLQELKPVMEELGISSPADLGYDKPELALRNPDFY
ncbi:cytochrome c oxidase subunit 5A, mitochondrial [Tetranychus urticae]|uniref:Cytochrome c oxidase subunit 5A, mitochondrial n=1 Tax=Tetranychus urticae TaxID=32264 RepID=T1JQU1_TETUR|nr:cytochrome c oxidase subunit 5A, mitochondrial [Tetranychus urticae]